VICEITKRSGPSNHQECGPLIRLHFGASDTGSWRSQAPRLFTTGVPKWRNVKRRNTVDPTPFRSFGYRDLELSRMLTLRMSKCRNVNSQKCFMDKHMVTTRWSHRRRTVEESSKQEAPFQSFGDRDMERKEIFTTGMPKCRNEKS
jgi:hypothetical protein